jgi:hypothetical protein
MSHRRTSPSSPLGRPTAGAGRASCVEVTPPVMDHRVELSINYRDPTYSTCLSNEWLEEVDIGRWCFLSRRHSVPEFGSWGRACRNSRPLCHVCVSRIGPACLSSPFPTCGPIRFSSPPTVQPRRPPGAKANARLLALCFCFRLRRLDIRPLYDLWTLISSSRLHPR